MVCRALVTARKLRLDFAKSESMKETMKSIVMETRSDDSFVLHNSLKVSYSSFLKNRASFD